MGVVQVRPPTSRSPFDKRAVSNAAKILADFSEACVVVSVHVAFVPSII